MRPEKFEKAAQMISFLLEKKAAGPPVVEEKLMPFAKGLYKSPESVNNFTTKVDIPKAKKTGVIYLDKGLKGSDKREVFRHELVHYLHKKKGRYPNTSKNSLTGLKDTFLNEVSAYRSQRPKHLKSSNPILKASRGIDILTGAKASTSAVYKGRILKSLLKLR